MKGAIIADLSARTWEHHTDKFYSNLISEEANLSVCSQLLLSFINAPSSILDEKSEYERLSGTGYLLVLSVLVGWKDFFNDFSYEPLMDSFSKRDQYLITVIGDIISRLRHGASKAQAIEGVYRILLIGLIPYLLMILVGTYSMLGNVSRRVGTILLLFTMAMYDYYGNKHLLAFLTGALAEAPCTGVNME